MSVPLLTTNALEMVKTGLVGNTALLSQSSQLPPFNTILRSLIQELSTFSSDLVLALDDYHVITNPEIHEALDYLLSHLPTSVHLVILTRSDPTLPLARLRVRNQLVEFRAEHLRFTTVETAAFLRGMGTDHLSQNQLAALEERTERWINAHSSISVEKPAVDKGERLIFARILYAKEDHLTALKFLTQLLRENETAGHWGGVIELLVFQALAFQLKGDFFVAQNSLVRALSLAEPEGYKQFFLVQGTPVKEILTRMRAESRRMKTYTHHLRPDRGSSGVAWVLAKIRYLNLTLISVNHEAENEK